MKRKSTPNRDIVSASEIGSWAFCPEAWRLDTLGQEPENRSSLDLGEASHAKKATVERLSRQALTLGWWLFVVALVLAGMAIILVRGL